MYLVKKEIRKFADDGKIKEPKITIKKVEVEVTPLQENMKLKRKNKIMLVVLMSFILTGVLLYFGILLW